MQENKLTLVIVPLCSLMVICRHNLVLRYKHCESDRLLFGILRRMVNADKRKVATPDTSYINPPKSILGAKKAVKSSDTS